MSTRRTADIVFCIDASRSMGPCFDAVQRHVGNFIESLRSDGQATWDLRFDFLAYAASSGDNDTAVFDFRSMRRSGAELISVIYGNKSAEGFFTRDVNEFKKALGSVRVGGDEATFIAIDTALDFPWRDIMACHRVLVILTDEELETGVLLREQMEILPKLIEKIHALRVMVFLVGPSSTAFDQLSAADKSEYHVTEKAHDGLAAVKFSEIMEALGKSVSASVLQPASAVPKPRPLFGQESWGPSSVTHLSGD